MIIDITLVVANPAGGQFDGPLARLIRRQNVIFTILVYLPENTFIAKSCADGPAFSCRLTIDAGIAIAMLQLIGNIE